MNSYKPNTKIQELIIMKGLPASGKTTEAKRLMDLYPKTFQRISKDDLRDMIDFKGYSPEKENVVRDLQEAIIRFFFSKGWSVIVDDTNLNPEHELRLLKLIGDVPYLEIAHHVIDFTDVPLSECIYRDKHRDDSVGANVIKSMAEKYLAKKE